jgi:hypothetical protein
MTKKQHVAALAGLLIVPACGATVYDAGSNEDDANPAIVTRASYYPPPSQSFGCVPGHPECWGTPCRGEAPPDVAGVWTGEFDDYALPSGSRAVRVEFRGNETFGGPPLALCGVMIFGTGESPPMPTDPDSLEAYPPGTDFSDTYGSRYRYAYEGFQYEFYESKMSFHEAGAVRFGIMTAQIIKPYCEMQTSYLQNPRYALTQYSCLPPHLGSSGGGPFGCNLSVVSASNSASASSALEACATGGCESIPISCEKVVLCESDLTCPCDNTGCHLDYEPDALVDLTLNGDAATGNIAIDGGIRALHLARVR